MNFLGTRIRFNLSFILLYIFITIPFLVTHGYRKGFLLGFIVFLISFFSIFIHELSHVKAANYFGLNKDNEVRFWALGGYAFIPDLDKASPKEEALISLAGPLSNLLISIIIILYLSITGIYKYNNIVYDINYFLLATNIGLFVFNILPAYPLDGGRILQCLLVPKLGLLNARIKSHKISIYISVGIILLGLVKLNLPLSIIGFGVFWICKSNLKAFRSEIYQVKKVKSLDRENML